MCVVIVVYKSFKLNKKIFKEIKGRICMKEVKF